MADKHALWVEKYRPKTLDEYIFHDPAHEKAFRGMVDNKTIPHLLLSGVQGAGKTTIAHILINALDIDETDLLIINASDENNVDTVRERVKSFVTTYAMGDFKVVLMEEADYMSMNGQAILRRLMEDYANEARFILTCNYEHKIIPALKSRCGAGHFRFKAPNRDDVTEFVAKILLTEKVNFNIELLDKYVAAGYPDIRAIIGMLQKNTHDKKLHALTESTDGDYKFQLLDLLERGDWVGARKLTCANVAAEEWDDVFTFLYENIDRCPTFSKEKWEEGIVIINDHMIKHTFASDPELNAAALWIRLGQV
jgi:replication factor C small subunit